MIEFIKAVTEKGFSVSFHHANTFGDDCIRIEYGYEGKRISGPTVTPELLQHAVPEYVHATLMESFNAAVELVNKKEG